MDDNEQQEELHHEFQIDHDQQRRLHDDDDDDDDDEDQELNEEQQQENTNSNANILNNVERDIGNGVQRRNIRTGNNLNPRDRLFYALFIKIGQLYARLVPKRLRTLLEVVVLLKGLLLFSFLSYLHFSFGKVPMNCLNSTIGSWPRDGVLRVQIQSESHREIQLPRFYSPQRNMVLFHPCHSQRHVNFSLCTTLAEEMEDYYKYHEKKYLLRAQCYRMNLSDFMYQQNSYHYKFYENFEYVFSDKGGNLFKGFAPGEIIREDKVIDLYEKYFSPKSERQYIFEYAQEFGFLRISKEARSRLKIPIKTVTFDPNKEKCFGDMFSRFILKYFLGYDDVLMNSIKKIADAENNTGYMLNVVTGDHYKFVSWGMGRSSYFVSLLLMFLFTISISTLLRYCHQQVFFFIIHLLQMMDMNVVLAFPIAPLFTVILSLVGMETIMSEYFNDTTTSFYIILIVWAVDQFDTICCHTEISQKYWLRFFYLYHFIFYSYHYRFNGQYSSIALAATWFLIQHSMFYFLHNYELPAIENEANNGRRDEDAYLDEAVQIIVEGIEMVAGQQNNINQQQQQQQQQPPIVENGNDAAENNENYGGGGDHANNSGVVDPEVDNPPHDQPLNHVMRRVYLFAADVSFLQAIREFIQSLFQRMNVGTQRNVFNGGVRTSQVVANNGEGTVAENAAEPMPDSVTGSFPELHGQVAVVPPATAVHEQFGDASPSSGENENKEETLLFNEFCSSSSSAHAAKQSTTACEATALKDVDSQLTDESTSSLQQQGSELGGCDSDNLTSIDKEGCNASPADSILNVTINREFNDDDV